MKDLKENQTILISIIDPQEYTKDLYESINGKKGIVIKKSENLIYKDAYLIQFDIETTKEYLKTKNGQWLRINTDDPGLRPMMWWIERKNIIVI